MEALALNLHQQFSVFDVDQESLRARTEDTSDINDSQVGHWGSQFGDSQNGSGIGAN